jgi:hypothetical protein
MGADPTRGVVTWLRRGARRHMATAVTVAGLLLSGGACARRATGGVVWSAPGDAQPPTAAVSVAVVTLPDALLGTFEDDYGSRYALAPDRFVHGAHSVYHIVEWHAAEQFFVAQNAAENPSDGGQWTRVDWLTFTDQGPFGWGYCFTAYRAATREAARATPPADRRAPRSGCHGFPFSRMRRVASP